MFEGVGSVMEEGKMRSDGVREELLFIINLDLITS